MGEGIDGFETRQVDCSAFVVNNKTETSSTSCPLPVVESGQACKQVLVGRFLQIGPYIDCTDHYIALNRDDWTIDVNDDFVYCAATGQLGATCEARLQLVSGQRYVQDHGSHGSPVTARELCQFHRMGCQIEDWGYDHGTVIKCPARE